MNNPQFSMFESSLVGGLEQPRCPNHLPASAAVLTERGRVRSLVAMEFPMMFSSTDVGSKMNLVSKLRCWDPGHDLHLFESIPDGVLFTISGLLDGDGDIYSFLGATLVKQYPRPALVIEADTKIFQHSRPSWATVTEVVELCSGFGGMPQGMAAAGFSPVLAVDFNDRMTQLYRRQCEITTLHADVGSCDTIAKIWHLSKGASTVVAGFACQPFSQLGDQRGEYDCRALSLRGVLAIAFYTQAQVVVLECVTPAAANAWVKAEVQRFVDATGFHLSQSDFHLSDIWPSRCSRAWWILTAPWLGLIPLPQWPTVQKLHKVAQVIPRVLSWAPEDEAKLLLNELERQCFGASDPSCARYLLNMEGCAPCALHSWGSQLLPCECGCRPSGLSRRRLEEKGLFGLLVRSVSDRFAHELRHIHPNECLALQGFDPTIDFGDNPRLTLAAAGQMASPFQALWVFSCLFERLSLIRSGAAQFAPPAQLQAYQSWILMRCRRVWPCDIETIADEKMISLMQFWQGVDDLSIHELMHPPRWPMIADGDLTIASVLDAVIRQKQSLPRPVGSCPETEVPDSDEIEIDDASPTPWFEFQPDHPQLPSPNDEACIVVFYHEFADPITVTATPGCTIHDFVQAHAKLVGTVQVTNVFDQHHVEISPKQVLTPGQVICIRCEDKPPSETEARELMPTLMDSQVDVALGRGDRFIESFPGPEHPSCTRASGQDPVSFEPSAVAQECVPTEPAKNQLLSKPVAREVSPTVQWTCPPHDPSEKREVGPGSELPDVVTSVRARAQTSWISAAPLLGLQDEQFLQLRAPAVVNDQHLKSLTNQVLHVTDRTMILDRQSDIWSDDECRHHMFALVQQFESHQRAHGVTQSKSGMVLDPLLSTGWLHHGLHECHEWGLLHPEVRSQQSIVITVCMLAQHWIPVVLTPNGDTLHVYTWDAPGHDHSQINQMCELLAKGLGFLHVTVDRHHRLFLTTNKCGALAMSFLSFSLAENGRPRVSLFLSLTGSDTARGPRVSLLLPVTGLAVHLRGFPHGFRELPVKQKNGEWEPGCPSPCKSI